MARHRVKVLLATLALYAYRVLRVIHLPGYRRDGVLLGNRERLGSLYDNGAWITILSARLLLSCLVH